MAVFNQIATPWVFLIIKNLSLENLGVQELDAREMVETDGGGLGPLGWNPMLRAGMLSYKQGYVRNADGLVWKKGHRY